MFIANTLDDPAAYIAVLRLRPTAGAGHAARADHNGTAYWIKLSAQQDDFLHSDQRAEWIRQDVQSRAIESGQRTPRWRSTAAQFYPSVGLRARTRVAHFRNGPWSPLRRISAGER